MNFITMFKTFYYDLTYLPRRKFSAKYTLPFLIVFFLFLIVGQLITQFITVDQLNKVSGNITDIETKITSWSHTRGSSHDTPNYSLVITLDNSQTFKIQDYRYRAILGKILQKGDYVIIYYPTTTLKILSAGFADDVSQLKRGSQVLYSWKDQQQETWFLIATFAGLVVFFYWMRRYFQSYMESTMLK
jgi:hypothetical protein